jgi:hypothetical protein
VQIQTTEQPKPEWFFMPPNGVPCPYSGLKRKALDFLTRPQEGNNFSPPVKSRVLTQAGKGNCRRMINYRSLMDYIEALPVEFKEPQKKVAALAHYRTKTSPRRVKKQEVPS